MSHDSPSTPRQVLSARWKLASSRPCSANRRARCGVVMRPGAIVWVPTLDPRRIERQTVAAASSPLLRGLSFDLAQRWQGIVAQALARRNGLDEPDPRCRLVANLVFVALSNAVNQWVQSGCRGDVGPLLDDAFARLIDVCREVGAGDVTT